jgi:hypothetical protein
MVMRLGGKAEGADFFDRITERDDFWRYLEGNHIVLSGPRRLGKTSLLQRLAEEAEGKGLLARLVDVEDINSAEAFVGALERAFPDESITGSLKAAGKTASAWMPRFRKIDVKLPGGIGGGLEMQAMPDLPWTVAARKLQQRLSEAPLLILIDEFSVFLEKLIVRDPAEAESLLGWLRVWRLSSGVACRFVFTGSIGLNYLLEQHKFSTRFNDCHDFRLGPFKPKAALAMLAEVSAREGWQADDATLAHLCQRTGWLSPFYLNLLLASSMEAGRDRADESGSAAKVLIQTDVDDGYDRLLASRSRFIHWYQRLERDLTEPDFSFALAVLGALAKPDQGLTRKQLLARLQRRQPDPDQRAATLSRLLLKLEEDGYVDGTGERILFLSFLLRDYWRRNHA